MKMTKLYFTALAFIFMAVLPAKAQKNIAYQDATVRFTVITDGVIRLEWQPEGLFTDSPSFVASERDYPEAEYKIKKTGKDVVISTSKMILTYSRGSGKFKADNLEIRAVDGFFTWRPGMKQKANLKGTFRTLDGLDGDLQTQEWVSDMKKGEIRQFEDGILAKDGWTLIDESSNYLFDDSDWAWVKERDTKECQDWYFMAYGHDYKAALKDFTSFAGKMPLPPRFAFGYWWSRYWAYSDKELRNLVDKFHTFGIPLDVLVVDMDWHYTDPGRGAWTGWTWNKSIFPNPEKFMDYLHDNNLKVTINLHPADGFEHYEWCYPALAESLGMNPESRKLIEWTNSDKAFMSNMFEQVMHPMQKQGVDFWWLDWQQHVYDKKLTRLHNTWWINYCYFTDMERNGNKRPLLYHRWGGLGNHRYQIGFSGDATITWKALDFQPYFTATASNVLYGYWSHDIGGHLDMGEGIDPEMYTRWLQYGAFSPVMRTHSSKSGTLNKEPWVFPEEYAEVIRNTVRMRYEMVPYIYTMARKGYDEGLALCRPLYYDYPEAQEAYDFRSEYMFGDDMIIAPVTRPGTNGFAEAKVWLPEGQWYEYSTGTLLSGGRTFTRHFAIDEYGIYIKAGSVLPFYGRNVSHLNSNNEDIFVTVFPKGDGSFKMYEDGGNTKDYADSYATTVLSSTWSGNELTITIAPREGSYEGMPSDRKFIVKVVASAAPASVAINGVPAEYEYDGKDFSFIIRIPETSCAAEKKVVITYAEEDTAIADGAIGLSRRISRSIEALKFRTGADPFDALAELGSLNEAATYSPDEARKLADAFMEACGSLPEILNAQPRISGEDVEWFLRDCGMKQ